MDTSMRTPPQSPLGAMYEEHIDFIKSKNIDGLIDNQGTQDAVSFLG